MNIGLTTVGGYENHKLKNTVIIPQMKLNKLNKECKNSPDVVAAINNLISKVIGSGIDVSLLHNGKRRKKKEGLQRYIEREFSPFLFQHIWNILLFGFDVYFVTKSKEIPGLELPVHPRLYDWRLAIGFKNSIREYKILKADDNTVIKKAHLSIIFPPNDDGDLTSPLAVLQPYITRVDNMWDDIEKISNNLANPKRVVEVQYKEKSAKTSGINPAASIYSRNDVMFLENEYEEEMNEHNREEFQKATALAYLNKKGISFKNAYDKQSQTVMQVEEGDTWNDPIILPRGHRVANTNFNNAINNVDKLIDKLLDAIGNVLGVSTNNKSGVSYAASVELELRTMNDRVKFFQNLLQPELEKMFETIWRDRLIEDKVKTAIKIQKESERPIDQMFYQDIYSNTKIKVEFNHTPMTDYQSLVDLNERAVIGDDDFGRYALKIAGLPKIIQLTETEREILLKKRRDLNSVEKIDDYGKEQTFANNDPEEENPKKKQKRNKEDEQDVETVESKAIRRSKRNREKLVQKITK